MTPSTNTPKDIKVAFDSKTIDNLKKIAPSVGVDPDNYLEVLTKAVKLLMFARKGKTTIDTPEGTYEVDLKKI